MINIIGDRYGRLVVVSEGSGRKRNSGRIDRTMICQCDCGNTSECRMSDLRYGTTKSCGCLAKDILINRSTKHGHYGTNTYNVWRSMIQRCDNKNHSAYNDYGGRGIKVCDDWYDFSNFYKDMGDAPKGMSLDRYPDKNGSYEKNNCRWATKKQQRVNTRVPKNSSTGVKGVVLSRNGKRYEVYINIDKKRKYKGSYLTLEEAKSKRLELEKTYY